MERIRIILFLFLVSLIFTFISCQNEIKNESLVIFKKMNTLDLVNDSLIHIVKSKHLKILNGGMPPKFYSKFGARVNSNEGKDIVLIEINQFDTLVQQIFLSSNMRNKVHVSNCDYFAGDTIKMDFVVNHITLWK